MVDVIDSLPEEVEVCSALQRELADKITQHAPLHEIRILLASGAKTNDPVVQGLKPLHYAVYGNYLEVVKMLLVRGSDINAVDDVGYSAMHLCAEHGNYDLIEYLVNHNAQVSFVDEDETEQFPVGFKCEEPLRMSVKNGHYECAELLLQHGADPNARYFLGSELSLISTTDVDFLTLLLMYGANPNCYNRDGLTPLMKACKHPLGLQAVMILLDYGADINAYALERQDFRTPIHYAILAGNLELTQYLIERGAVVNMRSDYDKPTPLDVAVIRDNLEVVECLLSHGGDPRLCHTYIGTPLHLACCSVLNHQYDIVKRLLEFGADPNSCPNFEAGPIRAPFVEYFRAGRPQFDHKIIQLLLAFGAEVVMQGPLKNPQGILRAITRLKEKDIETWHLLLDAGSSYDQRYVDRVSLPQHFKNELLEAAYNPLTLKRQARLVVRDSLKPMRPEMVLIMPIPATLKRDLVFGYNEL